MAAERTTQERLYDEAAATYGAALGRLARGYEANPDARRDLLQEIHLALWRSLAGYDGRCSLRTWIYRVAHNTAASYVIRQRRARARGLLSLDEIEDLPEGTDAERAADRRLTWERLTALIHRLQPIDRQVILSYLEGLDAASISEITGLTPGSVATRIHRVKRVLADHFGEGGGHDR
jgi:RNA polymerase sigma-70 factor (ECF subfamily)